jgi:hypothetical protein
MPRIASALLAALALALGLGACGEDDDVVVANAGCTVPAATIEESLAAAPGQVRLDGGPTISECVRDSRNPADLQTIGGALTTAAEGLERAAPRDPARALRLGYLIGAARRGAEGQLGIVDELVRRLERTAEFDRATPEARAALERGLAAGAARG